MRRKDQRLNQRLDQRLDDELRNAFKRELPSADFTMRVLDRVSLEPPPRLRWWQKLAMLLEPPKLRSRLGWIAIGATASLLLAIGAMQYSRLQQGVVNDSGTVAKSGPSQGDTKEVTKPGSDAVSQNPTIVTQKTAQNIKHASAPAGNHRPVSTQLEQQRELRAEGEAAKEKLMLALAIASSALSDAQKAVQDDGVEP
jgi:negative regulator of sigma E activity